MIPVERINRPMLLLSGEDDQMWPSPVLAGIAAERLAQREHPHQVSHRRDVGAGHLFTLPNLALAEDVQHPVRATVVALGDTVAANARAAAEA